MRGRMFLCGVLTVACGCGRTALLADLPVGNEDAPPLEENMPSPDGGSGFTEWFEDFLAPPAETEAYFLQAECSAWDPERDVFLLTQPRPSCGSRIFRRAPLPEAKRVEVTIRVRLGGPTAADGLTLAFVVDPEYPRAGTLCAPTNCGGYLDFEGASGFAVELDSFGANLWDPIPRSHLAIVRDGVQQHMAFTAHAADDGEWHELTATWEAGALTAASDGVSLLTARVAALPPFVGITAGTGSDYAAHEVDWWRIRTSP